MKYTIKFSPFHEEERAIFENLCHLVNLEWVDLQRQVLTDSMTATLVVEGHRDDVAEFELKCALLTSIVSEVVPEHASDLPMTDMDFEVTFKVQAKFADRTEAAERLYKVIQRAVMPNCDLEMRVSDLQVWGPIGQHMRATYRWVAAPGKEIVIANVASAGVGWFAEHASVTPEHIMSAYFEE